MSIASAPGGVFLFGEHAVVYGYPALIAAIGRRVEVGAKPNERRELRISSRGVGRLLATLARSESGWRLKPRKGDAKKLAYVTKAAELTFDELGLARGMDIRISSDFPPGSGLSSSSAVSAATAAAIAAALGQRLAEGEVMELAFRTELAIQGVASRAGAAAAAFGGFIKLKGDRIERLRDMPELPVVIGYTGVRRSTAPLVRGVKQLRDSNPALVDQIFKIIGQAADAGIESIRRRDLGRAGELMNVNQALLAALGVSSGRLERLIAAARRAGALGAKLSGAGGGGSMVALAPDKAEEVAEAIRASKGYPILTGLGGNGLVIK